MINLFCISTILCISLLKRLYLFFIYFGTEYFLNIFSFSAVNKNRFVISNLDKKTKETIENLSDEKANEMVKEKWIKPLIVLSMN